MRISISSAIGAVVTPLVFALSAWAAPEAASEPTIPEQLTVDEAVKIALANHPTLGQSRAAAKVAEARIQESWAPFIPSITGSFAYNPQTANRALSPSLAGILATAPPASVSFTPHDYWIAQTGLAWTLFDFGRTYYGLRAAEDNHAAATSNLAANLLQVALDVRTSFYATLAAAALVDVNLDSVATQQQHLEQVRGFVEVGTRTPVDLAQSESDVAAAQLTLARARGNYEAGLATLHASLGLESWHNFRLVTPPELTIDAESPPGPSLPSDPLEAAVHDRPEAHSAAYLIRAANDQRKIVRGAWFPSLNFALSTSFTGTDITNLTPNAQANLNLTYGGGLNIALIDGQRKETDANVELVGQQARATRNGIRLETAQAVAALRAAHEALGAARKLLAAATQRRQLANARYEAGLGTLLDRQDAEFNYVSARQQLIQSQYDLGTVDARIAKSLGR